MLNGGSRVLFAIAVVRVSSMWTSARAKVAEPGPIACWQQRAFQWCAAACLSKEADDWLKPHRPSQRTLVGQNTLVFRSDLSGSPSKSGHLCQEHCEALSRCQFFSLEVVRNPDKIPDLTVRTTCTLMMRPSWPSFPLPGASL